MIKRSLLALLAMVSAASAQAPETSLVPLVRPGADAVDAIAAAPVPRPETQSASHVFLTVPDPMQPFRPNLRIASAETPRPIARPLGEVARLDGLALSLRPVARPVAETAPAVTIETTEEGPNGSYQLTIQGGLFRGTQTLTVPAFADDGGQMVLLSPLPEPRPSDLAARFQTASARQEPARTALAARGQLCGSAGIFGEAVEPITGHISGCSIPEPVRVREVNGITLSTPAIINCAAATALQDWLSEAEDIVGNTGGGMTSIRVVASYSCRTRNNQPGARLSEHATGNGIDIAGIVLANGQELSVLNGWRDGSQGPILHRLHEAACGPFGTVLGPDGDRFHQDHFHFDAASYRSGSYCR